ncbi:MAG: hypothetical protein PHE59_04905 [Patescibacteria group bacterium]|nr:hypothetical protein [Patescibacteria group bacterium]
MDDPTWFSCRKVFTNAWIFGVGYGFHSALIIQFGPYVIMLGPHLPPKGDKKL